METSFEIKILITFAAMSGVYAFVTGWRADNRVRRLTDWLQATYPERWANLPWTLHWINRPGALARLQQEGLSDEPEFQQRFQEIQQIRRQSLRAILLGMLAIGLVLAGVQFWGWVL